MAARRRKSFALIPDCRTLETRLAPSGNFLSHGMASLADAAKHVEHHRPAEHAPATTTESGHHHHVAHHHVK